MNGALEQILIGVVANSVSSVLGVIGRKGIDAVGLGQKPTGSRRRKDPVTAALQKAITSYAKTVTIGSRRDTDKVKVYLVSSEVESIVRRVFSSRLSDQEGDSQIGALKKTFMVGLSLQLDRSEDLISSFGEQLFDALINGCDSAFESLVQLGVLSALEAKAAGRHRMVLGELDAISKHLAAVTSSDATSRTSLDEFERKYRLQVATRHSHISPPDFDSVKKVRIQDLYVPSSFVRNPRKKGEKPTQLTIQTFLQSAFRAVILGNPGGGKSTLMQRICHELASVNPNRILAGRNLTPIIVVLRDYGSEKRNRQCSILEFIESAASSTYQLKVLPGVFEYLLVSGRVAVLFDGLDELVDTTYRREISADVESFCSAYPAVPVLVTSREVGYEEAPLNEEVFETYGLSPFSDEEITEYVNKWFALDNDLIREEQRRKAAAFLAESGSVPDLRSNPLMLALMCNIYRGENYIPRNRPAVYEKCALMLFERWDRSRGIRSPLPFEEHIGPCIKFLAHWIHSDAALQGGVSENRLIDKATEYLCPRRFEDIDQARAAAAEFISFCRGRAWVFTDTGTDKAGERLYQFTHRTFLEYFTAAHLVRIHPSAQNLAVVLIPHIKKREWDVVAQLALQSLNKNIEGAGDELLVLLVERARTTDLRDGLNIASFATRCLEFMVPSPRVTREITTLCLDRVSEAALSLMSPEPGGQFLELHQLSRPGEALIGIVAGADENRATIADTVLKWVVQKAAMQDDQVSQVAFEIGIQGLLSHSVSPSPSPIWKELKQTVLNKCAARLKELSTKDLTCAQDALWAGLISVKDLLEWHGVEGYVRSRRYRIMPNTYWWSPAVGLVYQAIEACRSNSRVDKPEETFSSLRDVGRTLLRLPTPWVLRRFDDPGLAWISDIATREKGRSQGNEPAGFDADVSFGIFASIAVLLEMDSRQDAISGFGVGKTSSLERLKTILLSRLQSALGVDLEQSMTALGFSSEQQDFIWMWSRKEISLFSPTNAGP